VTEVGNRQRSRCQGLSKRSNLDTGERRLWSAAPRGFRQWPVMVPRPGTQRQKTNGWVMVVSGMRPALRQLTVILRAGRPPVSRPSCPYRWRSTMAATAAWAEAA